ncbi:MAG: hypothetical protein KKE11_06190, partial [Gammaproteobacteria bacterium]|nr:hypothetical protein [Gammaproteobacteria bacterium]
MKNKNIELNLLADFVNFAVNEFERNGTYFGHGTDNSWDEAVYLALSILGLPLDSDRLVLDRE